MKFACPECGSCDVQAQVWVYVNTGADAGDEASAFWCPDCEMEIPELRELAAPSTAG